MSSPIAGPSMRHYDFPLFCGLWLPPKLGGTEPSEEHPPLILLGGGGGAGGHGVRNRLALVHYDTTAGVLSTEVSGESTGADAAQAAAVHPGGSLVVVAFSEPGVLRCYNVRQVSPPRLVLATLPAGLEGVGEQRALEFSPSGDMLAVGGQDGSVRVVEWPSGRVQVHLPDAHSADVRSLAFSADGRFLATTSRSATCPVWDLREQGKPAAQLTAAQGSTISAVCFSRGGGPLLAYLAVQARGHGWVHTWRGAPTWARALRARVARIPLSAVAVSPSGALLACATAEGDVVVLSAPRLSPLRRVRGAHPLFVTGLSFAPDSRALLSISADSSARVTDLRQLGQGNHAWDLLLALLVVLLAVMLANALRR